MMMMKKRRKRTSSARMVSDLFAQLQRPETGSPDIAQSVAVDLVASRCCPDVPKQFTDPGLLPLLVPAPHARRKQTTTTRPLPARQARAREKLHLVR